VAKTVLYLHGIGELGGAERDLLAMLGALDRDMWEPHVGCPAGTPLSESLAKEGVARHSVRLGSWRKWYSSLIRWRDVRALGSLLTHLAPALIHVNDIWWVPHTIRAVQGTVALGTPIVAHVRQEIEPEKVRRYALESVDGLIAISKQVELALIAGGVSGESVRTIYSGLSLPVRAGAMAHRAAVYRSLGLSENAVLLGTVAHMFPRKGYDVMIRALPRVIEEVPAVQYVIVGAGQAGYEQELKALASRLNIAERIHFAGFQHDVMPFLSALSLYVHPARMEGFGIAIVEAMAAGKAVVATRVGGIPEVVDHGRTGLLVAPDHPGELSAAILSLLRDERRRNDMGEQAVQVARERFDLKSSIAAIERLYQHVLAARERE
jgi:glycosyltransferase involved in cell wall biosynthesis